MEIKTERLLLRPLGTEFLQSTHEYASDIENTKYMIALPNESLDETKAFLTACENEWKKEKPSFYEFAVLKDSIHIGAVSIYMNETFDAAILGWIFAPEHHGFGYAGEAAEAIMQFAKEKLSIRHFIAHCDSENTASERVMQKLGLS